MIGIGECSQPLTTFELHLPLTHSCILADQPKRMQTNSVIPKPPETPQKGETVLVYGAGKNQIPVIQACRGAGWRVVVIDRDDASPGRELADRFVCLSLRDHERILAATASEDLVGVVARITDHVGLDSSRRLARDRGLASPCPALFEASTSKLALARHCERIGVPTPKRYAEAGARSFEDGPVLVRPDVTIQGKAGIRRVDSIESMRHFLNEAGSLSASGQVDVSKWIDGRDVSVLAHLHRGRSQRLALWDEWVALDDENRIRGVGCGMPSVFQNDLVMKAKFDSLLDRLSKGFPESDTPIVLSLRIDESGVPWIIEIHLGVGGDGIAEVLLPEALPGFDAFQVLALAAAGEAIKDWSGERQPRALLHNAAGWQLVSAENDERLRAKCLDSLPANWHPPASLLPVD